VSEPLQRKEIAERGTILAHSAPGHSMGRKMNFKILNFAVIAALLFYVTSRSYALDADLGRFARSKEQQVRDLARNITNKVPAIVWSFFDAVRVDDWETATNLAARINLASHRYAQADNDEAMTPALATLIWPPIAESYGAYEEFHDWNSRWLHRFGREIVGSLPRGSIYFGGTDPGRFIISALCESQIEGKPFFTVTQNQLVDRAYLDYLRVMYGNRIHIPSTNDVQKAFENYLEDANERLKRGQLKPGEDVRVVNGRVTVSGAVAVMQINGLLAKNLVDQNPQRDFFVEESYALDWMYPYLAPHELIFQLNRQPLPAISEREVAKDQEYWKKLTEEMLGNWLSETTSVNTICEFAQKYGPGKHLDDYSGDKAFAANASARKCFSKLRTAMAGLYAWRMEQAQASEERERMYRAADLAFRQGYAIYPSSPEAIYRYTNLLASRHRPDDAFLIAKTSLHLDPENPELKTLVSKLVERY
jgi:hypothetical protein